MLFCTFLSISKLQWNGSIIRPFIDSSDGLICVSASRRCSLGLAMRLLNL